MGAKIVEEREGAMGLWRVSGRSGIRMSDGQASRRAGCPSQDSRIGRILGCPPPPALGAHGTVACLGCPRGDTCSSSLTTRHCTVPVPARPRCSFILHSGQSVSQSASKQAQSASQRNACDAQTGVGGGGDLLRPRCIHGVGALRRRRLPPPPPSRRPPRTT